MSVAGLGKCRGFVAEARRAEAKAIPSPARVQNRKHSMREWMRCALPASANVAGSLRKHAEPERRPSRLPLENKTENTPCGSGSVVERCLAKANVAGSLRKHAEPKRWPSRLPLEYKTENTPCGSGSVVERCLAKANVAGPNPVSRSKYAPLAQLVEQLTLNQWVPGSNP